VQVQKIREAARLISLPVVVFLLGETDDSTPPSPKGASPMWLRLATLRQSNADRGRRRARSRRQSFRLEGLEDRSLLSSVSSIAEFPIPASTGSPTGVTAGPDGNLWFGEAGANAIGMINPTTHVISSFNVPTANARPTGITTGPDGNVWFTEEFGDKIGVINPTTHAISEFAVPTAGAKPFAITAGPDGNLWFTELAVQKIAEINPTTHAISEFALYRPSPVSGPDGIATGPDGNLWVTDVFNTSVSNGTLNIGAFNPTTHALAAFPVPSQPYGITAGADGNIWYVQNESGSIGMINPTTHATTYSAIPHHSSLPYPYGITAGSDGNLWFTEEGTGYIGQINPMTDTITENPIPYTGSYPEAITTGPDGNLWFLDVGTNAIGVATLTTSQLVVTAQPPSSVTAGSGFGLTVTAEDSSGNPITSFNGTVTVGLGNNPGGATLGGTLTATASNGVATFSGLTLTKAEPGYTLAVSGSGLGEGVTNALTVTPAAATQLVITQQPPSSVSAGKAFGLVAAIEDQYGNIVTTANNAVSVSIATNPGGATLGGTTTVSAIDGIVTFSNLTLNKKAKGYTLRLSTAGLSSATTSPITVS
jgi:virginiamycin B lyase